MNPESRENKQIKYKKIYCTMNSPELTQASDEPKIKAPSSSSYLHDQNPDDSRSRVSSEAHCIV